MIDQQPDNPHPPWWRRLRQDLRVLARLFPWRKAAILVTGLAITAVIFQQQYRHHLADPTFSYVKAFYAILNMATFQVSYADMPEESSELDGFFVVVPLIGIPLVITVAADLLNILRVFLVRAERKQPWQIALASTIEHPIIVCGVEDRIGYRVASQILDLERPVVGIEAHPGPLVDTLIERDMPVIIGDMRSDDVLRSAGIENARAVLVCSHEDLVNIETAFRIREMSPRARIVLRLFEDEIADPIKATFKIENVISRSAIAAQAFAQAAIGIQVLETFNVYTLARVPLKHSTPLVGRKIGAVAEDEDITIICLYRQGELTIEPPPDIVLCEGDTLYVFTHIMQLASLIESGSVNDTGSHAPIIVCGLGHTGYRVVNALRALGRPVRALDYETSPLAQRLEEEGVSVQFGDFRQRSTLERAGIQEACAIVACTENEMDNFETALRAREANADARIVMRIFEEALGNQLQKAFNIDAVYSTSAIAAPAFVAAALKINVVQPVEVGNRSFIIARIDIETLSGLYRETIDALNQEDDITVLLHQRGSTIHVPPEPARSLVPGDVIIVLVTPEKLRRLSLRNRRPSDIAQS